MSTSASRALLARLAAIPAATAAARPSVPGVGGAEPQAPPPHRWFRVDTVRGSFESEVDAAARLAREGPRVAAYALGALVQADPVKSPADLPLEALEGAVVPAGAPEGAEVVVTARIATALGGLLVVRVGYVPEGARNVRVRDLLRCAPGLRIPLPAPLFAGAPRGLAVPGRRAKEIVALWLRRMAEPACVAGLAGAASWWGGAMTDAEDALAQDLLVSVVARTPRWAALVHIGMAELLAAVAAADGSFAERAGWGSRGAGAVVAEALAAAAAREWRPTHAQAGFAEYLQAALEKEEPALLAALARMVTPKLNKYGLRF